MMAAVSAWLDTLSAIELGTCVTMLVATLLLRRASMGIGLHALIAWPGTVGHEAAHAAVGLLLGAKPCQVSLWPKHLGGGRWQLGAVGFARLRWWNAPWTALAPLALAPIAFYLAIHWAAPRWGEADGLGAAWRLFLCSVLLHSAWPSRQDFEIALPGLLVLAGLGFFVYAW